MPESETTVVFRILGILASARDLDHALVLDEIADAAHLGKSHAARYITVLEQAGAVRAEATSARPPGYSLTKYGLGRLVGDSAARGRTA
jgi:DNA-binding IclR family transcriptional regulator